MKAGVFPGQGSQFPGMAEPLYKDYQSYFDLAERILGFDIAAIMFKGDKATLSQTRITQPAIFIHSVLVAKYKGRQKYAMMAGHSLGEFSALVASKCIAFEEGLKLVHTRATAMQKACDNNPSTMAAVLGAEIELVDEICAACQGLVVVANYNCPGQIVISGTLKGIEEATAKLKKAGAKRVIGLPVAGAFHSPLMAEAQDKLNEAVLKTKFETPLCPIYQNVDAAPHTDPKIISANILKQLVSPVRWQQTIEHQIKDRATQFVELGPGRVLAGLIRKINRAVPCESIG